jgi:hypothetical protein
MEIEQKLWKIVKYFGLAQKEISYKTYQVIIPCKQASFPLVFIRASGSLEARCLSVVLGLQLES